jgi:hypothetical protein
MSNCEAARKGCEVKFDTCQLRRSKGGEGKWSENHMRGGVEKGDTHQWGKNHIQTKSSHFVKERLISDPVIVSPISVKKVLDASADLPVKSDGYVTDVASRKLVGSRGLHAQKLSLCPAAATIILLTLACLPPPTMPWP